MLLVDLLCLRTRSKKLHMKKKVLVTLLVIALAVVSVSAKDSSMKLGVELGYGFNTVKNTVSGTVLGNESNVKTNYKNNGFAVNLSGEYLITDNWSVKADVGMMFAGKANIKSGDSDAITASEISGLYMDYALDAKYTHVLNKDFSVSALMGLELLTGHIRKTKDEDTNKKLRNTAFGVNFGAELSYAVDKHFSIVAGCDFAWLFVNNCESLKTDSGSIVVGSKTYASAKSSNTSLGLRPYLGATYAF